RFRGPVVLCYLEGKSNEEAARLLGCPLGTVQSRLARARERLRGRLTRRGLALSAAALAAFAQQASAAAVPPVLLDATVRAAALYAVGSVATTGSVSAAALALVDGAVRSAVVARLTTWAGLLLALALVAGTAYLA